MALITISRGTLSGGKKLAEMLCERLGYRCVSREIIIKAAENFGIPERKLFEAIQKGPSIFERFVFERERYIAFIQATLCEYAKDDNVVYHGNAGHFLLRGISHVLRIRIVADLAFRTRSAMEQFKLSEKEAEKYIKKVDKERIKWTKFLYGSDWRSPELYDIVFNLKNVDLDFVCQMIGHAIKQPQFQTTPESRKAMRNLLVASRVRAALARAPEVRVDYLKVTSDDGVLTLEGKSRSDEISQAIVKIASEVPGVVSVNDKLKIDGRSYPVE
jgi:cytidylate kinase